MLEHAQARRVLMVLPARSQLNSVLDFDRLRRSARQLGCELAFVTKNLSRRSMIQQAGLPVFFSVDGAKRAKWRKPDGFAHIRRMGEARRFAPNSLQRLFPRFNILCGLLNTLIAASSVIVLAALMLVWVPTAKVTLTSASRNITTIVPVNLDTRATALDVAGRVVPATRIESSIAGTLGLPSTGQVEEFTGFSSGSIQFFGITSQEYRVPRGTIVTTSGSNNIVRFATTQDAVVPSGGSATTSITSIDENSGGQAGANQINAVEGAPSLYVTATNPRPVTGAGMRKVEIVTSEDYRRVRAQLLAALTKRAAETLGNEPAIKRDGLYVVPASVNIRDVQNEAYAQFVGEKSNVVTLTLSLQVSALAINPFGLNTIGRTALLKKVPAGFELMDYEIDRGDEAEEGTGNRSEFFITARGRVSARIDDAQVKRLVRGKTPADAQSALLNTYLLQRNPVIVTGPDWIKPYFSRLPLTPLRIETDVIDVQQ